MTNPDPPKPWELENLAQQQLITEVNEVSPPKIDELRKTLSFPMRFPCY